MKYHCLFEQSGTFKNEFKKLGLDAYDYDILNNFGQTDFQMDLFSEIEKAYDGKSTIFDKWGGGKTLFWLSFLVLGLKIRSNYISEGKQANRRNGRKRGNWRCAWIFTKSYIIIMSL